MQRTVAELRDLAHAACHACGARAEMAEVLVEAALGDRATEPMVDLARRVMSEAAAHEWRTRIYPIQSNDGRLAWRFLDPLPVDGPGRLRELGRLNRMANQLVVRLSGMPMAHWLQLSLFGPETLVPPVSEA